MPHRTPTHDIVEPLLQRIVVQGQEGDDLHDDLPIFISSDKALYIGLKTLEV